LYFLSNYVEVNDTTIAKLTDTKIESIQGRVIKIEGNDKVTNIVLEYNKNIDIIAFEALDISEGDKIIVIGQFNEDTFIADKIVID